MIPQYCQFCFEPHTGISACPNCHCSPSDLPKSTVCIAPGTLLHGRYQIGKVLKQGKFSTVYLAWNVKESKKIAIKEFFPIALVSRNPGNLQLAAYDKSAHKKFHFGLERFLDEALTLTKFQKHPLCVSVHSLFKANDTGYMVMEYIEGVSLTKYIKNKGTLNWTQTLGLFSRIMDLLNHVHAQGIIHAGISPDKIYLCKQNRLKLLGFSQAKQVLGEYTQLTVAANKPGYAAWEQYQPQEKQGAWTDIYAIAACMYYCLTAQTPPEANLRAASDALIKPSLLDVDLPVTAELALLRALAVSASLRPQSFLQFYHALTRKVQDAKTAAAETINRPVADKPEVPADPKQAVLSVAETYPTAEAEIEEESSTALKIASGLLLTALVVAIVSVIRMTPKPTADTPPLTAEQVLEQNRNNEFNHALILQKQGRSELAVPIFTHLAKQGYTKAQAVLDLMKQEAEITPDKNFQEEASKNEQPAKTNEKKPVSYHESFNPGDLTPKLVTNAFDNSSSFSQISDDLNFENPINPALIDEHQLLSLYKQATQQKLFNHFQADLHETTETSIPHSVPEFSESELGIGDAQSLLATLYFEGKGLVQDYNQAIYWYQKAADLGNQSAATSLNKLNLKK